MSVNVLSIFSRQMKLSNFSTCLKSSHNVDIFGAMARDKCEREETKINFKLDVK